MAYRFKQSSFKNGALFAVIIFVSSCATNEVNLSSPLKIVEKSYPLIYEIKEGQNWIGELSDFVPGQDNVIIENDEQWQVINLMTKNVVKTVTHKGITKDFSQFSKANNRLLVASYDLNVKSSEKMEIWDTQSWQVLQTFNGGGGSVWDTGLSPDGRLLFMEGILWDVRSGEKIMDIGYSDWNMGHSFSSDNHYIALSSDTIGIRLIDIKAKKEIPRRTQVKDAILIHFSKDNYYYASYNYDLGESYEYGGNYPKALGLFSPANNELVKKFVSQYRISCWTIMPDGKVFVSRVNGEVMLLSPELVPLKKWSIKQKANYCAVNNKNQIWLGVDESGVYKIDLIKQTIEHPIKLTGSMQKFMLSQDGKYLGFETMIDKLARVRVYQVD